MIYEDDVIGDVASVPYDILYKIIASLNKKEPKNNLQPIYEFRITIFDNSDAISTITSRKEKKGRK